MSQVLVANQAHSLMNGVDSYLPDLDARVKSWRSTLETMPVVPEREMKLAMSRVKQLLQALPSTKAPLSPLDARVAKQAMVSLWTAFQDVLSLHEHNTLKLQQLRDQFLNEEIMLASQMETLLRQARSIEQERDIVYENMENLQRRAVDGNAHIIKQKKEVETHYRSLSTHQGLFLAAAAADHHSVASLEHDIKLTQADLETWRNSAIACEASQDDRIESLGEIAKTKAHVANRKSTVSVGRRRCDEILLVALPKLQSLHSAVRILGPFTAETCQLETMDVVELYRNVLSVVGNAIVTASVADDGSEVLKRVRMLSFAYELTQNMEEVERAISTVY